jgi:hypothetical protein
MVESAGREGVGWRKGKEEQTEKRRKIKQK